MNQYDELGSVLRFKITSIQLSLLSPVRVMIEG